MEQVLHRGITAALAAAVAGAGLIAITPVAPPPVDLPAAAVHMDVANAADSAADLFTALSMDFQLAGTQLWTGLTDLAQLDLSNGVGNLATAVLNLVPAVPENILLAAVGGLLGQDFDPGYLFFPSTFAQVALTSWGALFSALQVQFGFAIDQLWLGVQHLFQGHVVDSLNDLLVGINYLVMDAELVVTGPPVLLIDGLLSLVGL